MTPDKSQERKRPRWRCWSARLFKTVLGLIGFYVFAVIIGLWPVNRDFVETPGGVEIFISSSSVHSDLILPIQAAAHDWRDEFRDEHFLPRSASTTHVAVGWGDRGFYIETPTWADLKISTACQALLLPSQTVVHVSYGPAPQTHEQLRSVTISPDQYHRLVEFIQKSFALDSTGKFQAIPDSSYGMTDAFYIAQGRYHCFNTCNCWTGNALETAGVKVGWFTPLPRTVFLYLP